MTTRRQTPVRRDDVHRRLRQSKASRGRREVSKRSGRAVERGLGTVGMLLMAIMAWPSCPGPVHGQEVSQRDATAAPSFEQWVRELTKLLDVEQQVDVKQMVSCIQRIYSMELTAEDKRLAAMLLCQALTRREELRELPSAVRGVWSLMSPLSHVQNTICEALIALGDKAAVPHLQRLYLEAATEELRIRLPRTIRALGGEVPEIEERPRDDSYWPQESVLSLAELKQARAELILRHLQEEGWDTTDLHTKSAQAIYELGELRATEAVAYLLEQLGQDTPFMMRVRAIAALGKIGDPGAVDPLIALLGENRVPEQFDASDDIRREAVRALREMRAQAALPDIKRCLDDPEPTVRQAAFAAVCDLGGPEDRAAAIEKLRNDPDPEVRRKVERALRAHGAQPPAD